ncbi:hypothetical protein ACFL0W_04145 [Nanoarchaeota archaeon]
MSEKKSKDNFSLLSIVAIFAIAGIVIMVLGSSNCRQAIGIEPKASVEILGEEDTGDLAGMAYNYAVYANQTPVKTIYSNGEDFFGIGEVGIVNEVNHDFTRVHFNRWYSNPIVIAKPISYAGAQPAHARIKSVTSNGFSVRMEEWYDLDGYHAKENVFYMVVEAGDYTKDGKKIKAGITTANDVFARRNFGTTFNSKPVVFASIVDLTDPVPLTTRFSNIDTTGFSIKVQQEENNTFHNGVLPYQNVAYIALQLGEYRNGSRSYMVGNTGRVVNSNWYTLDYPGFDSVSAVIADMQSIYGGDTADLRYRNFNTDSIQLKIQEETSRDTEVAHTTEKVGYLVAGNKTMASSSVFENGTLNLTTHPGGATINIKDLWASNVQKKYVSAGVFTSSGAGTGTGSANINLPAFTGNTPSKWYGIQVRNGTSIASGNFKIEPGNTTYKTMTLS